jgi:TorA maturation chaperone TorD
LLARRELWLLVSASFVDPYYQERFSLLGDRDFRRRAHRAAELLVGEQQAIELGPGEAPAQQMRPAALFAALDAEAERLEQSYRALLGSRLCPPCGVEYEPNTDVTYRAQQMADIAGFYRAFGLEVASQSGERLDHLTVEAEFLYLLTAKEAAALAVGLEEPAQICRAAREKFFAEHVGWWLPAFASLLGRAAESAFYRSGAALVASLTAIERTNLNVAPFTRRVAPNPADEQVEAACLECPASHMC